VRHGSSTACDGKTVAHLNTFDGLDSHEGSGQLRIESPVPVDVAAQTWWEAVHNNLDDSAKGVTVLSGSFDLFEHRGGRRWVKTPHGVLVDDGQVSRARYNTWWRHHLADADNVAQNVSANGLSKKCFGDCAERHACGRLTGTSPLQYRTGIFEPVLLHAHEVGVSWPRPRQWRVAGLGLKDIGVDRVGRHHRFPLWPFGIGHLDGYRSAHSETVPDSSDDANGVLLELHSSASAYAKASSRELGVDAGCCYFDGRGKTLSDGNQRRTM
jgi:hypothetical protein